MNCNQALHAATSNLSGQGRARNVWSVLRGVAVAASTHGYLTRPFSLLSSLVGSVPQLSPSLSPEPPHRQKTCSGTDRRLYAISDWSVYYIFIWIPSYYFQHPCFAILGYPLLHRQDDGTDLEPLPPQPIPVGSGHPSNLLGLAWLNSLSFFFSSFLCSAQRRSHLKIIVSGWGFTAHRYIHPITMSYQEDTLPILFFFLNSNLLAEKNRFHLAH